MAITKPNSYFLSTLSVIDIYTNTGELISPSLFTVLVPSTYTATVTGYMDIETELDNTLEVGDSVTIALQNKIYTTIVNAVSGKKINLCTRLPYSSGSCTVQNRFNKVLLDADFEEGLYYIQPTNEKLVVRNSYNNPYITITELGSVYADALALDRGMEVSINREAISKVYSDLGSISNIYDVIWYDRIRQLLIYAILQMLFPTATELKEEYQRLLTATRSFEERDIESKKVVSSVSKYDWGGF